MDREKRKDLLEVIGFVAVIGSLIFVGIETKNSSEQTELNTRAVEIAAYQQLMSNISEVNALSIMSDQAAAIIAAMRDWPETNVHAQRVSSAFFQQFRHGDMAYFMFERGVIDEDRLRSSLRPLPLYGESGRSFWRQNKGNFVESYQQYIDRLLEEGFWG